MQPSPALNKSNTPQQYSAKTLYLRLLRYAWQHWYVFAISVTSLAVYSATNTGFLAMLRLVTDQGFVNPDSNKAKYLPFMLFGLLALRAFCGFISNFSMRWLSRRVVERLRMDVFERLMRFPVSFFDEHSAGEVTSKLTYDTEQMSNAATKVVISLVRDSLTIIGMICYMFYLEWHLTLIFAVMAPLIALYLRRMTPFLRSAGKSVQESVGSMTRVLEEAVSGQRVVKIFGGSEYEIERFSQASAANRRMQIRLGRISGVNSMVVELIAAAALAWVVYYSSGKFSAGDFTAFIGAVLMLITPVKSLTNLNEDLQVGMAAAQSVFTLMDSETELDSGDKVVKSAQGKVEFRHVGLRYLGAKRDALHAIDFIVQPGEKIALVGRSGGGKSSLVSMLPRFYEMQTGVVLLDGLDIRALSLKSLRAQFALVSQDVTLFNDTVFNNIAYGVLRGASEADVIKAAQAAYAWEFIQQLSEGLHTEIGDRGVRLSGGQRQRLAIARAILKNAPILLLDEATSALDTESERHVQAALDVLMQDRTTFIIAHRLSTIENADRIMVLDQGAIVETGSHAELLAHGGQYAKLYQKQFH